jgi:hypothetical protein
MPSPSSSDADAHDLPAQLPPFMPGLELHGYFYEEAVRPIVERHFPTLRWGAACIQAGSDVLGFDTERSMDHGWGPNLTIFVAREEYSDSLGDELRRILADELPYHVRGFPTRWGDPEDGAPVLWRHGDMVMATGRPLKHHVGVGPAPAILRGWIGVDPLREEPWTVEEWLCVPTQRLRNIVAGAVYRDDTGELARARGAVRWYPHDIWLYLMAAQWLRLEQEVAFMGRSAEAGDELGSRVIAGRLVREVIQLCFLMERQYAPYSKWFGSGFAQLACAPALTPHLMAAMRGETWQERDGHMAAAYRLIGEQHNALGITERIDPEPVPFHTRPFTVPRFEHQPALIARITDERVLRLTRNQLALVGSISQWADSTDVLDSPAWWQRLRHVYAEIAE